MAHDILRRLIGNSLTALDDGTYDLAGRYDLQGSGRDLAGEIDTAARHAAVISKIKFSSPSEGRLRTTSDPATIATDMIRGGARGLSVLTQPHLFGGSPDYFARVRQAVDAPMLMKDVIVDTRQIDAAAHIGADYVLLIQAVFESGLLQDGSPDRFISHAHKRGLGVLLEVHTAPEYRRAQDTRADMIGINNRNLDTLAIDMNVTCAILAECGKDRTVVSESGITSPEDVIRMRGCGADGLLIGSSIMKSGNIEQAVRRMVSAH